MQSQVSCQPLRFESILPARNTVCQFHRPCLALSVIQNGHLIQDMILYPGTFQEQLSSFFLVCCQGLVWLRQEETGHLHLMCPLQLSPSLQAFASDHGSFLDPLLIWLTFRLF